MASTPETSVHTMSSSTTLNSTPPAVDPPSTLTSGPPLPQSAPSPISGASTIHDELGDMDAVYATLYQRWDIVEKQLVPLQSSTYSRITKDRKTLILKTGFDRQVELSQSLKTLLSENQQKITEINTALQTLPHDLDLLDEIRKYCSEELAEALAIHRDEFARIDFSGIAALDEKVEQEKLFFHTSHERKLKSEIAEANFQIQRGRAQRDPTLSKPDIYTDQHKQRDELVTLLGYITMSHLKSIASLKTSIQQLRLRIGATASWNEFHMKKHQLDSKSKAAHRFRQKLLGYRKILDHNLEVLQYDKQVLMKDFSFTEMLSCLTGKFDFMRLPFELRLNVYDQVLTFYPRITITTAAEPRVKLWSHPLFFSCPALRDEAMAHFYGTNHFGLLSKAAFDREFCVSILQPQYLACIETLSIAITNFGYGFRVLANRLPRLRKLRTLNIYIPWDKLLTRGDNDRMAVEAFKLLLLEQPVSPPDSTSCYFLKQEGAYATAYSNASSFASQLSSLTPMHQFAILSHAFRRRSDTPQLPYPEKDEVEIAGIGKLINLARHEMQYKLDHEDDVYAKEQFNESVATDQQKKNYYNSFPKPLAILNNEANFTLLRPDLQINIYNAPLNRFETVLTKRESDKEFTGRVLDLKDPELVIRGLSHQSGHIPRPRDSTATPILMTKQEISGKLDKVLQSISAKEQASAEKRDEMKYLQNLRNGIRGLIVQYSDLSALASEDPCNFEFMISMHLARMNRVDLEVEKWLFKDMLDEFGLGDQLSWD